MEAVIDCLLKLNWGFIPTVKLKLYGFAITAPPLKVVVRSITALLSKTVTTLNYYYRGTSPHCSHCLAAAEATGLLLQVFRVWFYKSVFSLSSPEMAMLGM